MGEKENQSATKHGGEGAIRRVSTGQPFLGIALDQQHSVEARLETEGLEAIIQENAIRLQTASDLYYSAVLKAAQDGDAAAFDRFIARYGWIAGVTLRAWAQVKQGRKHSGGKLNEVLAGYASEAPGTPERDATAESDPLAGGK